MFDLGVGATHFVLVFAFFVVFDQGLVRHLSPAKARYFILHVAFNAWLSATVWRNAWAALARPGEALRGDGDGGEGGGFSGFSSSGMATTAGIASFHLYHALFFTGIKTEDWIHHVVSCAVTPAIGIMLPFGRVLDVSNLGMCGIPGGVDYFLLALQKCEASFAPSRVMQKKVSALMNLLLRWPLMLLSAYMFFVGWNNGSLAAGSPALAPWLMLVAVLLHSTNAAYYCHKVIGNYHVVKVKAQQSPKKTTTKRK